MTGAVILSLVSIVSVFVVTLAYRERARLSAEVRHVVSGIERRTAPESELPTAGASPLVSPELDSLLDDAVQAESPQAAILAVNELTGRVGLARSRAHLFSRGLPRVTLLSGGGGAFVLVASGNFSQASLVVAVGSVCLGLVGAFTCHGLTASCRRLAKRYAGIVDVLARQVDRHFSRSE